MKIILVLSIILLTAGCASLTGGRDNWIGASEQEVIKSYGEPSKRMSDGKDGAILMYRNRFADYSLYDRERDPGEGLPADRMEMRLFYLDPNGKVYSVDDITK
ncbi:MAG: hypothetical protein JW803_03895 [Endomicrobiales bacterium]|nr:hypothetical protein [Endomicrobiales bacterium]